MRSLALLLIAPLVAAAQDLPSVSFDSIKKTAVDAQAVSGVEQPSPLDAAGHFPAIGKWMLDKNGRIAHWLNQRYHGRLLDEPINVILRVRAQSAQEAREKATEALEGAGFYVRGGHSYGYSAMLDGIRFPQMPSDRGMAFADADSSGPSNHGRLFGPARVEDLFYFIGAFSRENVGPPPILHPYWSFKLAREALAQGLSKRSGAKIAESVSLNNSFDSAFETTGDHDGMAVVIDL